MNARDPIYLCISAESYEQMLHDQGIAVLDEERRALHQRRTLLEAEMRQIDRKITALTSTIAALHIFKPQGQTHETTSHLPRQLR